MEIQIVRFKDGLDVISYVEDVTGVVELTNPMMFEISNANLLLQHWLPLAVMKQNSVKVPREEILCFMEPNDDFAEYYDTAVSKVNVIVDSNKDKDRNEMELLMDAMEELETNKLIKIH